MRSLRPMIVFLFATLAGWGTALLVMSVPKAIGMLTPAKDIYDTPVEELKENMHVSGNIYTIMDYYCGVGKSDRMYVFTILEPGDDGYVYMGKFVSLERLSGGPTDEAENCANAFLEWWTEDGSEQLLYDNAVSVDGVLVKLSAEQVDAQTEYLKQIGYSNGDIVDMLVPYAIRETSLIEQLALTILGLFLILGGGSGVVVIVIKNIKDLAKAF